jgi:hypothetical protein
MKISTVGLGGPYSRSIVVFQDVIGALEKVEGAPKFYSTDFSHQYVQFGGYGNIWGLVTIDPDGLSIPLQCYPYLTCVIFSFSSRPYSSISNRASMRI